MRRSAPASHNRRLSGGFPHSDIPGSKGALASPGLIAECHVLHRLLLPRHPPNALIALDPIQKTTGPFACSWFGYNPRPIWSEVLTRAHPLGRERAGREPRTTLRSDEAHGQCHLTWKDCFGCPAASLLEDSVVPRTAKRRTRHDPHSGRTQNVSCIALFTISVSCRRARAIGQEGSPSVSLPI